MPVGRTYTRLPMRPYARGLLRTLQASYVCCDCSGQLIAFRLEALYRDCFWSSPFSNLFSPAGLQWRQSKPREGPKCSNALSLTLVICRWKYSEEWLCMSIQLRPLYACVYWPILQFCLNQISKEFMGDLGDGGGRF